MLGNENGLVQYALAKQTSVSILGRALSILELKPTTMTLSKSLLRCGSLPTSAPHLIYSINQS